MIDTKQLRRGNIVCHSANHECIVDFIYPYSVQVLKDERYLDADGLYPIPLTEEWLLKFGFDDFGNEFRFSVKSAQYKICKQDDWWFIGISPDSKQTVYFAWHIYCVHQLQNLYFALTNTELTITDLS